MTRAVTNNQYGPIFVDVELVHPKANLDMLGYIPCWLDPDDPDSAAEQLGLAYARFGGWTPRKGWTMNEDSITFPGDPPRPLIARMRIRDEEVRFYLGAYIAIVQPDGSHEIARMD